MSEIHLIEALALTNLFQLIFWVYQVHTLINKTMSKNFAEYNLIKSGPLKASEPKEEDNFDEEEILGELNGMLPNRGAI